MTPEHTSPSEPAPPVSRRRTNAMAGCIRFPVDDIRYASTREGGMVVKLVVVDDRDYDESEWNICCGGTVVDLLCESFVGDDQADVPQSTTVPADAEPEACLRAMQADDQAHHAWEARHFPMLHDNDPELETRRYLSRPYLATLVLGVSGWSGYNSDAGYWRCTTADLTENGLALYRQLQALYPGCTLHLLTFLDT